MKRTFALFLLSSVFLPLASCGPSSIAPRSKDVTKVQQYNKVAKKGDVFIDPVHGEETSMVYGAITGVGDTNANGVGFMHTFQDGTSVVTINLNILPFQEPEFITAVLKNDTTGTLVEIGKLSSIVGDARHSVKLETSSDLSSSMHVVILKHTGKGDVGTMIAEGFLKKPSL